MGDNLVRGAAAGLRGATTTAGLVSAPIFFATSDAAMNYVLRAATEPTSDAMVAAIRAQQELWLFASIASILASLAFIPATLGLLRALGPRPSALGMVGTAFLGLFIVGFTGHQAVIFVMFGALARNPGSSVDFPFSEATGVASPDALVLLIMFLAGITLGCILIGVALWRARTVPRWSAVAIILFPILAFASDSFAETYAGVVASLVQGAVLLSGFTGVALRLMRDGTGEISRRMDTSSHKR